MHVARRLLIVAILLTTAAAVFVGWLLALHPFTDTQSSAQDTLRTVVVGGGLVHVSVADTETLRQQGLSGKAGLAPNEGMLFVFPSDGRYAFWMKDMLFSIDMLWLSADGRIVYLKQRVSPDTYPQTFAPDTPARYVLELPAGYAAAHQVRAGDVVQL